MNARPKFRLVENCPQPEPPAYKPIVYGAAPWSRLTLSPPADELAIRARAQSLMSRNGKRAELPDLATALRVIERESKPRRCTVPKPNGQRRA